MSNVKKRIIVDFRDGIDGIHGVAMPLAGPAEADAGRLTGVSGGGHRDPLLARVYGLSGLCAGAIPRRPFS